MRFIFIILILISSLNSFSQNQQPISLGIGFVSPANPYKFESKKKSLKVFIDSTLKETITNTTILPFFYKPDYGLYHLVCLSKSKTYYKILINNTQIGFVPNDTSFTFFTWNSILLSSSIKRLTKNNPIKISSNETSNNIEYNCQSGILKVLKVKSLENKSWIQVSFPENCETYPTNQTKVKKGWILWKEENKILVEILLNC